MNVNVVALRYEGRLRSFRYADLYLCHASPHLTGVVHKCDSALLGCSWAWPGSAGLWKCHVTR